MLVHLFILLLFISGFSANTCYFDVKLEQELQNQGFHRNLTYKVVFGDKYEDRYQYEKCLIGIDQMLPAGVYANPDELGDLRRMHKLSVIPKNRVNVELPAEQSQPSSVFIIGTLVNGEANVWLPVHARYHQAAKGGGYVRNEIELPHIYIRCPHLQLERCKPSSSLVTFLCNGHTKDTCTWKEISFASLTESVTFSVPIGDTSHYQIVAPATICTIIVFSLYLLKTLHEYKLGQMKKRP